jgi:L-rhamnose mutarotase
MIRDDEEVVKIDKEKQKYNNQVYELRNQCYEILAIERYNEFLNQNSNAFFARFEYSDNDGTFGSVMEHGDIFRKLNSIRISHH